MPNSSIALVLLPLVFTVACAGGPFGIESEASSLEGVCACTMTVDGEGRSMACGSSICVGGIMYACSESESIAVTNGCMRTSATDSATQNVMPYVPPQDDAGSFNDAEAEAPAPPAASLVISGLPITCNAVTPLRALTQGTTTLQISGCSDQFTYELSYTCAKGFTGSCSSANASVVVESAQGVRSELTSCTISFAESGQTTTGTIIGSIISGTFVITNI